MPLNLFFKKKKNKIKIDSIELNPSDFRHAFKVVVPTAQRSAPVAAGEPLPRKLAPLLEKVVNTCLDRVKEQLGVGAHESFSASTFVSSIANANDDHGDHVKRSVTVQVHLSYVFVLEPAVFRPRLVICGESSAAVGAAVINMLAPMPVQALDMATLMQVHCRFALFFVELTAKSVGCDKNPGDRSVYACARSIGKNPCRLLHSVAGSVVVCCVDITARSLPCRRKVAATPAAHSRPCLLRCCLRASTG